MRDPLGAVLHLLTGVLSHFIGTARGDLNSELGRYLFTTVDPSMPGAHALTANPTVAHLNGSIAIAADILVGAVVVFASERRRDRAAGFVYPKGALARDALATVIVSSI